MAESDEIKNIKDITLDSPRIFNYPRPMGDVRRVYFDPECKDQIVQVVLKAGAMIRLLKGLPQENNITELYNETVDLLGLPRHTQTSKVMDRLPLAGETGPFQTPRKKCPTCGKEDSAFLVSLCRTCKDSENGKYRTAWYCPCGYKEVSEKFFTQWAKNVPTGTKEELGIKTLTDEGLK